MRSLSYNKLGPDGAAALAPGIAASTSLTALDARHNGLDNEAQALLRQVVQGQSGFDLKV